MTDMQQLTTITACKDFKKHQTAADKTMALVPTMGALHDGHMALIETARQHADVVIVSIFVNPLQFGPNEDYTRYPRPIDDDLAKCQAAGVDAVFTPNEKELYPESEQGSTCIIQPPPQIANLACGGSRPGHFAGVCTVVGKLFNIIQPDVAVFGEKDAQQLTILQAMANSLNWPVSIIAHPIQREASGLAISSRNQYLTESMDKTAALLPSRWLNSLTQLADSGLPAYQAYGLARELAFGEFPDAVKERFHLDYITAVDKTTFQPVDTLTPNTRIVLAAWVGDHPDQTDGHRVRLIDNHVMSYGAILPDADISKEPAEATVS
jgi:pantoate--beta-alanine ligase